ncbi:ketosteroid isomerase-like protein [Streptomyces sp. 3211.6]|uniref:nuclear transport factor 2 family protein n=1 Tax=Streptomyces TaxID=1883 RepID=UPI0009A48A86|nr:MULTISPECIES: nuclear transport factor 2 family protein [Streptomyces]RKT04445.1 ketosteroid isomerase-like protein [Streptomyces sp. 3211.6]RPF40330.1 ketosteroid isomerase-like protein [Streptomyces sp. Ag109_G2-6]
MTTTRTARELAETYFTAWEAGDFDTMRGLLAEDVDFVGALGTAQGTEEALAGLKGLGQVLERIDVKVRVAEGDEVITWFDLCTSIAPPAPTANWMHAADGKITRIRVTFDPRALLAGFAEHH